MPKCVYVYLGFLSTVKAQKREFKSNLQSCDCLIDAMIECSLGYHVFSSLFYRSTWYTRKNVEMMKM